MAKSDNRSYQRGPTISTMLNVVFTGPAMIHADRRDAMYTLSFLDIAGAVRTNGPHPNAKRNRH